MEPKSLYTLLGVRPDASVDQIEHAYAALLHELQDGSDANPGGDARTRLIAVKEAYTVLSNPVARQVYNQKLFAPQTVGRLPEIVMEPANSWGVVKLLIIGAIVISALWIYNRNTIEKEKLLIEHEKQLIATQVELEREQRQTQAVAQQHNLKIEAEERERRARQQALRDAQEMDSRVKTVEREKQQADREAQYQKQQEESRQRQLKLEAERQIDREKRALRELQNQNRSNGRYY